jgi:cytochrome c553
MKILKSILLLAAALLSTGCANPGRSRDLGNPAIAGSVLAQQACSMCHGVTGVATSPNFPNLAAQTEGYVVAQLTEFRSHSREDPAGFEYMWGVARRLTDVQIADLATYYAKQKPAHQAAEGDAARVDAGRALFTQGAPDRGIPACGGCHGDHGQGLANFPRLAGQHTDYVIKQLRVFQRTNERPDGNVMKVVAHGLSPDDVANAASFVQGL